jgi:hypothetical protein
LRYEASSGDGLEARIKLSGVCLPEVESGVPSLSSGLQAQGDNFDGYTRKQNRPASRLFLATTEQRKRSKKKLTRIPVPVNKSALWASEGPGQLLNRRAVMLIPGEGCDELVNKTVWQCVRQHAKSNAAFRQQRASARDMSYAGDEYRIKRLEAYITGVFC